MQRQRRPFNYISNAIRAFEERKCISEYSELKLEIEKEIDVFNKRTHTNFYQQWDKINKNITGKNNKIKNCVNKGYVSNDLYAVDTIKSFRERCLNRNAPTCSNSSPSQVRKSPELKISGAGDSCKTGKNCKEGIAAAKLETGKSQSRTSEEDRRTISSPRTYSKHQHQNNSLRQDRGDTNIVSQPQSRVAHSDSNVVPEVKEPEQINNGDSSLSNREEAQAQPLPVLETSKENTFETSPIDQPLQTVTTLESDTGATSQVRGSGENTPQSETPHDETDSANTTGLQSYVVAVAPRTDVDGQAVATNTRVPESAAEGVSLNQNHHQGDRISASTGNLSSANADLGTTIDNYTGRVTTDTESSPVKTACTEASSDQASGSETPCSNREDSELFNDNGNILDRLKDFFESIPNNERVIKTSAPIGIALLLGLLFNVN
ncbi:hypothetical protein PVNG_06408 [Plasmodium vivax North Korean]|uniref:Variable surface protein Vir18 n=1 Tax=Plasmodium vivax North Korean TaxID=1035514 RepID=A0A0J9U148_PLAVI|nr:hypothetical protein PVNG_06408 [Plasmodium vivax North Korean]